MNMHDSRISFGDLSSAPKDTNNTHDKEIISFPYEYYCHWTPKVCLLLFQPSPLLYLFLYVVMSRIYLSIVNLFLYSLGFFLFLNLQLKPVSTASFANWTRQAAKYFIHGELRLGRRAIPLFTTLLSMRISDIISNCTVLTRLSDARQLCRINLWSSSIIADNVIIINPHQRYNFDSSLRVTWLGCSPYGRCRCLMPLRKSIGVSGLCKIMYSNSHPADSFRYTSIPIISYLCRQLAIILLLSSVRLIARCSLDWYSKAIPYDDGYQPALETTPRPTQVASSKAGCELTRIKTNSKWESIFSQLRPCL